MSLEKAIKKAEKEFSLRVVVVRDCGDRWYFYLSNDYKKVEIDNERSLMNWRMSAGISTFVFKKNAKIEVLFPGESIEIIDEGHLVEF